VVWPDGTEWADSTHRAVKLETGVVIPAGASISGGGGTYTNIERKDSKVGNDIPCLGNGPTISMVVISAEPLPVVAAPPA
jgi:hypothetical protein